MVDIFGKGTAIFGVGLWGGNHIARFFFFLLIARGKKNSQSNRLIRSLKKKRGWRPLEWPPPNMVFYSNTHTHTHTHAHTFWLIWSIWFNHFKLHHSSSFSPERFRGKRQQQKQWTWRKNTLTYCLYCHIKPLSVFIERHLNILYGVSWWLTMFDWVVIAGTGLWGAVSRHHKEPGFN